MDLFIEITTFLVWLLIPAYITCRHSKFGILFGAVAMSLIGLFYELLAYVNVQGVFLDIRLTYASNFIWGLIFCSIIRLIYWSLCKAMRHSESETNPSVDQA
jgi:hypothetical protein